MSRLSEEYSIRNNKIKQLRASGLNPYPARTKRTHEISKVLSDFDKLHKSNTEITVVGRIKSIRLHGGSCFIHIEDGTSRIQIYLKKDKISAEAYSRLKEMIDIGDFIQATGSLFITKKGEKTVLVTNYSIIAKSLNPLPEKWHGLADVEIRYRKRYLDLIANPDVKINFTKRSQTLKTIRKTLDAEGFLEVETPILQTIPGGANARPFSTHHNSLNTDLFLRIAPELFLKKLIIGGFEKVYEIARCFRNEGIDRDHNPEFTQVEYYAAYWDYRQMMKFTEKLFEAILKKVNSKLELLFENKTIDFTAPYQQITFKNACKKYAKIDIDAATDNSLKNKVKQLGLDIKKNDHRAKILDEIFKELIRPKLIQPTFIIDYPLELSPLAKKKDDDPNYVERFQLVAAGRELANGFSELNDPIDQKKRFQTQEKMREAGDEEAQRIDEDFIEALSYGMPPTAGIGIGLDRLTSLLCNQHTIKEVILFPTLKPKK